MLLLPMKLGNCSLSRNEIKLDKKNCFIYGPSGVGDKAIYLNSFYINRFYYLPITNIKRVFKRVAIAKGAIKASIPYLVVVYDDSKEKQCIFKVEQEVDSMLNKIKEIAPNVQIGKAH